MPSANMALLCGSNLHLPMRLKRRRSGNEFPHKTGPARKACRMKMKMFAAAKVAALFAFGLAAYSQGTAHPHPTYRSAEQPLCLDGRWCAISDAWCAGQQLQRLAGDASKGVARDRVSACQ